MYFLIGFICGAIAALIYFKIQSRQVTKAICQDENGKIYYFNSKYYDAVLAQDRFHFIPDDILFPYLAFWNHNFMGHVDQREAPKEFWLKKAKRLPKRFLHG